MEPTKRIGLYLDASTINRNPGYLETLREGMGLTLVIIGFSGEVDAPTLAMSPFDATPPSDAHLFSLLARHIDGEPSTSRLRSAQQTIGPHVHAGGDDDALREAIRRARAAGLEIWLLGGAWTANDYDVLMYCPSNEEVNRWFEAVYTHMATHYDVDGVDITHARFPMTSYPRGLFLCACPDCARSAAEMGYDMGSMIADIHGSLARIKRIDGDRIVALSKLPLAAMDLWQLLGAREGLLEWFRFRAELIAQGVARFRNAVHAAAGHQFIFGADTYPASLSMFAGHDHSRWDTCSDFASPLLSHVNIFPMQTMTVWAEFLQRIILDLSEKHALEAVYRLVGYDGLNMPTSFADFCLGAPDCEYRNIPLRKLLTVDMAKAAAYLPQGLPSYPIIQGGGAPHDWPRAIIDQVSQAAIELGHHGVIYQGTSSLVDVDLQ